uniref:Uncharacterized protein n=1 Tax=Eptatretus burgeri TaxID=7764 RepID=A0A8C4NA20_EPTBU
MGFHGCIRDLYINGELQDLQGSSEKIASTSGVLPGCPPCRKKGGSCLHGTCLSSSSPTAGVGPSYVCHCHPDWKGPRCDQQGSVSPPIPPAPESSSPCNKHKCIHGSCVPLDLHSYGCHCRDGFTGVLCNEPERELFNPCRGMRCKHGVCRLSLVGKPFCECHAGYAGNRCDREVSCHDERITSHLQTHRGYASCHSVQEISQVRCHGSCQNRGGGGSSDGDNAAAIVPTQQCCSPTRTKRRRYTFRCTDGSSFIEEVEKVVQCGCDKCHV